MEKIVPSSFVLVFLLIVIIVHSSSVLAWSNGGYSDDPSNPDYGTHDWIAEHALDWLPEEEKRYIVDNLVAYSYGTELPDNGIVPDGIGDTANHHIYYWSNGSLQDDVAALRADEEYNNTLDFLELGDLTNASKVAGIMSHYIVDMAVFGHVMGSGTDWGTENHHSDYETYVNQRTDSYDDEFNTYLSFDGELTIVSAYDAAIELAYDTTFDLDGDLTCVWMDQNYNWSGPVFKDRCGESLNLAVNYLTDVLHTLYLEVASVHNIDSGKNFSTIQEAINDNETLDGHTIFVDAGTYYENVVVKKTLSLVGEDRETTIIDGNMSGTVVNVKANGVLITNFTIRNSNYTQPYNSGIRVWWVNQSRITNNLIMNNFDGIDLLFSHKSIISGNKITNNGHGVYLAFCPNSTISGNFVSDNQNGIVFGFSPNTNVSGNKIEDNRYGFHLASSNSSVTGNTFVNSGLFVQALPYGNLVENNTVNSKPLVYLVGVSNYAVENAGQVILINCSRIQVENLDLSNTTVGVQLEKTNSTIIVGNNMTNNEFGLYSNYSSNNSVCENNISNNTHGIVLHYSSNNTIQGNNINRYDGIHLADSNNNKISANNITNDYYGIYLRSCNNNRISGNNITANQSCVDIDNSENNIFSHNNFIDNRFQVWVRDHSPNYWDDGYPSGGNYWSDYTGIDLDNDGIGDTPYDVDFQNRDNYPLMGVFSDFEATSEHHVQIICNSTVSNFLFEYFTPSEIRVISFNVKGEDGTTGFCRICIPTTLMDEPYVVLVNATEILPSPEPLPFSNSTHNYLYFTYSHSTQEVIILHAAGEDSEPPSIGVALQKPEVPDEGENVTVMVDVTDLESGVHNVTISYSTDGGESWNNVTMQKTTGNTYQGEIPGLLAETHVQYKIVAYDNAENPAVEDNAGEYYVYTVIPEFSSFLLLPLFAMATLLAVVYVKKRKLKYQ